MARKQNSGFAVRLRELRKQADLTQEELARRCGMTVGGLARIEQGKAEPGWLTVIAIAAALGVTCEAFTNTPAAAGV